MRKILPGVLLVAALILAKSSTDISATTPTISSSFGSGFKLSVSLPTAQPSQPTSTAVGSNKAISHPGASS